MDLSLIGVCVSCYLCSSNRCESELWSRQPEFPQPGSQHTLTSSQQSVSFCTSV